MQVRITIRGREYTVRGDDNAGQMQALAVDLDRRMSEMAERTRSFDEYTNAMMTALNLASELQQLKSQVAGRLDELARDAASVAAMLEAGGALALVGLLGFELSDELIVDFSDDCVQRRLIGPCARAQCH